MNHALLVIDVQNDFCPNGALAVTDGDQIVKGINAIMPEFNAVIMTQDWHPRGHSSFATSNDADPMTVIQMPYGAQVLWPDHCIIGTSGADFHQELNVNNANMIIRKGYNSKIDSYSAFFENDRQTPTGLMGYLQSRGIDTLTLVGLATDFCVNYSALDAAKLGFDVTVRMEMCRAIDFNGSLAVAVNEMKSAGVRIT
ncbi:MAG: bifunctional nicotinamidase/pyrazinamidase [Octadecabacter sp.]|nr:bifunctional nicotinamidase/pyrazinamidase [Octadecabacter sp.]